MKATIPLGRFAGIPVGAHWSVLVTVALMAEILAVGTLPAAAPHQSPVGYWCFGVGAAVVFFGSLLAHELSHALLARRFGLRIKRITLWLLGGSTQLEGMPPRPRADGLIALAGPASSLLLGGVFFLAGYLLSVLGGGALAAGALVWLAAVNVLLGVFNLLPGAPLDGGRVLRAVLWSRWGDRQRANRAAAGAGQILGIVMAALGMLWLVTGNLSGLWFILLGWFLGTAAAAEAAGGPTVAQLARFRISDVMTAEPVSVPGWWTVAALIEAMTERPPRHRVFPVVGFDGRATGVLSLAELARVPAAGRTVTRVQDVGRPLERTTIVTPHGALPALLSTWRPRSASDVALVMQDGQLLGLITAADIARAVELATLMDEAEPAAVPRRAA